LLVLCPILVAGLNDKRANLIPNGRTYSEGPSASSIPLKSLHRVRIACWPVVSRVLQYPYLFSSYFILVSNSRRITPRCSFEIDPEFQNQIIQNFLYWRLKCWHMILYKVII